MIGIPSDSSTSTPFTNPNYPIHSNNNSTIPINPTNPNNINSPTSLKSALAPLATPTALTPTTPPATPPTSTDRSPNNIPNSSNITVDQSPNSTAIATKPDDTASSSDDHTSLANPQGYRQALDPNIKHLQKNMDDLVAKKEYETMAHTMRTAIDTSITGIKWNILNALKVHADQNRLLVDKRQPGRNCIEKMHEAAVKFINFVISEADLNTDQYKHINWANRQNILKLSSKNVKEEVCTLEIQLSEFARDCIRDINRMGHVGFGLQNAPSTHPRYINYETECEVSACQAKIPDWATAPAPAPPVPSPPPKMMFAVQPQPVVVVQPQIVRRPVYALTTTTLYRQPAMARGSNRLAYNVGKFAGNVANNVRQGFSKWG